ncbi:putative fatty acyl-CoA reductase [Blattella germanica]|nr:putative fatty acyl-CoA reductase [Blattella germanica]
MAGSISEFYKGKNVFITGGSGFIGRVLIEKLLRSCPDIGNIYVLIRRKKGIDIWERVDELVNVPLFQILRDTFPENLKKIIPIEGDCMSLRLGLSDADYQILEDNVNIVFHIAASVRFDDPIGKATILNVRGTREIMLLAKKIKNLKVMITGALPNTYLFTKALAEHVVKDLAENLPVVIIRPSIGILRSTYLKDGGKTNLDCIPCDYTVRVICAAAWDTAKSKEYGEPIIYNVTAFKNMFVNIKDMVEIGSVITEKKPLQNTIWVPRRTITQIKIVHIINVLLFQLIPAILLDQILKWNGHKPILASIQRKIWRALNAVEYFNCTEWTFKHDRTIRLNKQLGPNDNAFNIEVFKELTMEERIDRTIAGVRKYLLKETQSDEENRKQLNRLKLLEKVLLTVFSIFVIWLLYRYDFYEYIISFKSQ